MFALEFPVVLHIFNDDAWLYRKKLFFQDWETAQPGKNHTILWSWAQNPMQIKTQGLEIAPATPGLGLWVQVDPWSLLHSLSE